MSACARFVVMIGARPGELSDDDARALADHVADCGACQARLADADALSSLLPEALLAEANRRDFSEFSDGVLARIPAYRGTSRGPAAARSRGGLLDWIRHHRFATAVGTLAPALAALAVVVYVGRAQGPGDEALVQVTAENGGAMILDTREGPIVLLGDEDDAGT